MRRREFITLLGGAAAAWPLAARGQQLSPYAVSASSTRARRRTVRTLQARMGAFVQEMHQLGWIDGRNLRIDQRAGLGNSTTFANTRRNWSRSRRTLSWSLAPRPWSRFCRRRVPCRSCL